MSKKKQIPTTDSDIKLIRKANEFVEARYKFDIWETRVFAHMLTLIKFNDTDFVEYRISVSDIVKMFGLTKSGGVYEEIKKASEKLLNKRVQIERTSPEGIVEIVDTYLVVSTARPKEATKDNYIKLRFHSDLKPFLLELKQRYLVYDIRNILSLTSIYSVRLFELLKQYQKIGKRRFELDELKSLLSIEPNEYALYGHFKERVIKKAQKDLKQHTDIYFEFEEETEKKRVYAIVFWIHDNVQNKRTTSALLEAGDESAKELEPSKSTKKSKTENPEIERIWLQVNKYVSKLQVKKWVKELPIDQIEKGILYTINYVQAGNKVSNIGGMLNTMVHTPNLFDKYEEKKSKSEKQSVHLQEKAQLIQIKKAEIEHIGKEFRLKAQELELQLLSQDASLESWITEKVMSNSFYERKKSWEENLQREIIQGLWTSLLTSKSNEYAEFIKYHNIKIKGLESEIEALKMM